MEREQVLTELYVKINNTLFGGSLPVAMFMIHNGQKNRSGWKLEYIPYNNSYLIHVAKARLLDSAKLIYENMMHQIVHILNWEDGITDTCRNGQYHTKLFKKRGIDIGLEIRNEKDGHGFCWVDIPAEMIDKINYPNLEGKMNDAISRESNRSVNWKSKNTIYYCPVCKREAKAGDKMKLYCGFCNVSMIRKDF